MVRAVWTAIVTIENGAAMTATISTFDCGDAQIRPHFRHLVMVVTIHGGLGAANVDAASAFVRRLILARDPLVLDVSDVNSFAAEGISLLYAVADECRTAGVEWTLVASPAVSDRLRDSDCEALFPTARSVAEALHHFADEVDRRRQALLPLVRKTA